ncbi:hypothetical protein ACH5RR_038374 [Cinchona calisaya]|uniref:Uncharacterized protein n=1 Tax=Cinchona calisaya TaxID=153742 RepID=A0ABD2XV31_9GENT
MDREIGNNNIPEDPIQREIDQLDESNKKKEQTIRKLETRTAQTVNLYFIFQAVILASITSSTSLSCHHWWLPFTISLLAAVLNFFAFVCTAFKVLKSREELDQDTLDLSFIKLYRITRAQVNQVLPGTEVAKQGNDEVICRPKVGLFQKCKRSFLVYSSLALFVGFSLVIMYACHILLCHSNGGNCVKVC